MAKHLQVIDDTVIGMPEGSVLLFLAKTDDTGERGFCAVFGPATTCLPQNKSGYAELFGATVAIFGKAGILDAIHPVTHGHKYWEGGGFAEIDKRDTWKGVAWQKTGSDTPNRETRYMGCAIHPEDVLVAL